MIRHLLDNLGRRTEPRAAAARPADSAGQKTVLIIDDHPDSLQAMCLALADETYRLETAGTAEAAARKLFSVRPDLILLDPRVPTRDAMPLARRLLADEDLAAVPMVALRQTGTNPHGDMAEGGRFDGHIEKPIDAGSFPRQVRGFLESPRRESSNRAAEPSNRAAESSVRDEGSDLPATPGSDRREQAVKLLEAIEAGLPDSQYAPDTRSGLHKLAEVVADFENSELVAYLRQAKRLSNAGTARARGRFRSVIRLCQELVQSGPDTAPGMADLRAGYLDHRQAEWSSLEQALEHGDFALLRKAGHNLKGTGAAYGFAELTEIGRALEAAAKDGNAAAIEVLLDRIDGYIGIVRPLPELGGDYEAGI